MKIKEKIVDILIVIIGITIAFALNSWYENNQNEKIVDFYKDAILVDLKNDKQQLTDLYKLLKTHEKNSLRLIDLLGDNSLNNDSLFFYLNGFNRLYKFQPLTHNYEAFSTHPAQTAKELPLKMKLDFLFVRQYRALSSVEDFYQDRLNTHYFPQKETIVSSSELKIKRADMLKSYKFKDVVESLPNYIIQEKNVLSHTIKLANELIKLLENEK